jgi:hypothetical protein
MRYRRGICDVMPVELRIHLLRVVANVTLAYPFLAAGLLYGCWLHAWQILGHKPVAWIDDPAETLGYGLYLPGLWLAIVGMLPAFITSAISNIAYVLKGRPSAVQAGIRAFTAVGIWLWFWNWVYRDPNEVFKWWMD